MSGAKRADGVGAQPTSVHRRIEVQIDAGVAVDGVFGGLPLDRADDPVRLLDHEQVQLGRRHVVEHLRLEVIGSSPPRLTSGVSRMATSAATSAGVAGRSVTVEPCNTVIPP